MHARAANIQFGYMNPKPNTVSVPESRKGLRPPVEAKGSKLYRTLQTTLTGKPPAAAAQQPPSPSDV